MSDTRATLHYFDEGAAAAGDLAAALNLRATAIRVHRFPDGEALPRVETPGPLAIVHATLDRPDGKLFPLALATDALRRAGAGRIVLVAPYLPYMRQDAVFAPGQPVSQRVMARFLGTLFDRVVTVDAHLHRARSLGGLFAPAAADDLASTPALAEWIRSTGPRPDLIVGPDEESEPWVRAIGQATGAAWLTLRKVRHGDAAVAISLGEGVRTITGQRVLLVDDICSSGGTLRQAVLALNRAGAADIQAYVTHALFDAAVATAVQRAGASLLISSDSIPHPSNAVRLCDVLAAALRREALLAQPAG